jgi:hypothetical protein
MVALGALHVTPLLSMLLPIRVEVTGRDKRSSLPRPRINDSRKNFYGTGHCSHRVVPQFQQHLHWKTILGQCNNIFEIFTRLKSKLERSVC